MTKKQFKKECDDLEKQGWSLLSYEPEKKTAVYKKGNTVKSIGGGK